MTEGITHYRIVMERGGWGMQHRERDKNIGIVVLTRIREQRINRWPNIETLVEDSKHIHDDSVAGPDPGTADTEESHKNSYLEGFSLVWKT